MGGGARAFSSDLLFFLFFFPDDAVHGEVSTKKTGAFERERIQKNGGGARDTGRAPAGRVKYTYK